MPVLSATVYLLAVAKQSIRLQQMIPSENFACHVQREPFHAAWTIVLPAQHFSLYSEQASETFDQVPQSVSLPLSKQRSPRSKLSVQIGSHGDTGIRCLRNSLPGPPSEAVSDAVAPRCAARDFRALTGNKHRTTGMAAVGSGLAPSSVDVMLMPLYAGCCQKPTGDRHAHEGEVWPHHICNMQVTVLRSCVRGIDMRAGSAPAVL